MSDNCLPKKLLVCASAAGSRVAGEQKRRWCDMVVKDLKRCSVERALSGREHKN